MNTREIFRIFRVTANDPKPLYGILAHLTSEVGELAEAVEIHMGHSNKKPNEPLIGEVADVIQCALSVLARAYKDIDNDRLLDDLNRHLKLKNDKWEKKQDELRSSIYNETAAEPHVDQLAKDRSFSATELRTIQTIADCLGVTNGDVTPEKNLVTDLYADSLDLVDLAMALEDEFMFEISQADEAYIDKHVKTVQDVLDYINTRVG